jgi:serine-type D-Ala-D-Ala carboxypeptidase (penicillin-binding protein 5/6)
MWITRLSVFTRSWRAVASCVRNASTRKISASPQEKIAHVNFSAKFSSAQRVALVVGLLAASFAWSQAAKKSDAPVGVDINTGLPVTVTTDTGAKPGEPQPPGINAAAFLVVEATSGQVLAESRANVRRDPASLTKLMTAYLVFDALHQKKISLTQRLRVPERAWKAEGSRMFIEPGTPVTTEDLLRGLIIQSGNDAAIALAITVAGNESEFISLMNREAKRLGMSDTNFLNPTGLTQQGHYSTAYDLGVLSLALMRDFPQYVKFYAEKSYTHNKITQENRNRLLFLDPTVDGLKTGHTDAAGWCLIATVNRPPRKVLTVLLGAPNDATRIAESKKLIDWAFSAYESKRFYEGGKAIQQLTIWKSNVDSIPIGFRDDVTAIATAGKAADITTTLSIKEPKIAPIQAGDTIGTLTVKRAGSLVYERNVIALEAAPQAGFFKRAWHGIVLWWKSIFK